MEWNEKGSMLIRLFPLGKLFYFLHTKTILKSRIRPMILIADAWMPVGLLIAWVRPCFAFTRRLSVEEYRENFETGFCYLFCAYNWVEGGKHIINFFLTSLLTYILYSYLSELFRFANMIFHAWTFVNINFFFYLEDNSEHSNK